MRIDQAFQKIILIGRFLLCKGFGKLSKQNLIIVLLTKTDRKIGDKDREVDFHDTLKNMFYKLFEVSEKSSKLSIFDGVTCSAGKGLQMFVISSLFSVKAFIFYEKSPAKNNHLYSFCCVAVRNKVCFYFPMPSLLKDNGRCSRVER